VSFSLHVLADHFNESVQSVWLVRLSKLGVECTLPAGFALDRYDDTTGYESSKIRCVVRPPLVEHAWPAEPISLYVTASEPDREYVEHLLKDIADEAIAARLRTANIEFYFESSANRSNSTLIFQCYAAAALAEVSDGILIDPQEGKAVIGPAVYEVARANSDWVLHPPEPPPQPLKQTWWTRLFGR
jgi:hypothetical protein